MEVRKEEKNKKVYESKKERNSKKKSLQITEGEKGKQNQNTEVNQACLTESYSPEHSDPQTTHKLHERPTALPNDSKKVRKKEKKERKKVR